jgi:hypothetical protein
MPPGVLMNGFETCIVNECPRNEMIGGLDRVFVKGKEKGGNSDPRTGGKFNGWLPFFRFHGNGAG